MKNAAQVEALKALLQSRNGWYLWVMEYGITHSFMRLALHDGSFPLHHAIECGDCDFFSGNLHGGPYFLEVDILETERGSFIEISSTDKNLRLVCQRFYFETEMHGPKCLIKI
jgi:hypothetical protein